MTITMQLQHPVVHVYADLAFLHLCMIKPKRRLLLFYIFLQIDGGHPLDSLTVLDLGAF